MRRARRTIRATTAATALALALAAGPAAAQSTRYPREPIDADRELEERSEFWERALEPDRGRYDLLLARARRLIDGRAPADLALAIEVLGGATEVLPAAPDAYFLRGWAHEITGRWPECADDYAAAAERDPDFEPVPNPRVGGPLADALGVCLARAGRFEEAEVALAQYTGTGEASSAIWMRLGEIYMALGRLDDAIAALDRATDRARGSDVAAVHWLRATALDRARRPAAAADEAATALRSDPRRARVPGASAAQPTAPVEDYLYHAAIAYTAHGPDDPEARGPEQVPALPERAIVLFREFVRQATTSPWRRRAEEHLAALRTFEPADALTRPGAELGNNKRDPAAIARQLRKDLAGLAGCLERLPQVVVEVRAVIHGPPPKPGAGSAVVAKSRPAAGAWARTVVQIGELAPGADLPGALKCLEQGARRLRLPRLERGMWVQIVFPVVSR